QDPLGILLSISGVDNRWHRRGFLAYPIKNLRLLYKPKIFLRRVALLLNVGQDHLAWIANEKAIRYTDKPFSIDFRQQMMRHLFLIKNLGGPFVTRLWNRSQQLRNHFPPIDLAMREHFISTRLVFSGHLYIKRVH